MRIASLAVLCLAIEAFAVDPAWWTAPTTTIWSPSGPPQNPDNAAPANVGQLKLVALQARTYLDRQLAHLGGAGDAVVAESNFALGEDDYAPASLGQLKRVAAPFYARLHQAGVDVRGSLVSHVDTASQAGYLLMLNAQQPPRVPWDPSAGATLDLAPVNIGQLKLVFSFLADTANLSTDDSDSDTLPDGWEQWSFGDLSHNQNGDFDLDGRTNGTERLQSTLAYLGDTDGDGYSDHLESTESTDPRNPNSFPPNTAQDFPPRTPPPPGTVDSPPGMYADWRKIALGFWDYEDPYSNESEGFCVGERSTSSDYESIPASHEPMPELPEVTDSFTKEYVYDTLQNTLSNNAYRPISYPPMSWPNGLVTLSSRYGYWSIFGPYPGVYYDGALSTLRFRIQRQYAVNYPASMGFVLIKQTRKIFSGYVQDEWEDQFFEVFTLSIRAHDVVSPIKVITPPLEQAGYTGTEPGQVIAREVHVTLAPIELAVDVNRDGLIEFDNDITSDKRPYRFWLNNDHDLYSGDTYDDDYDHPWPTEKTPDNDSSTPNIASERDLEDLSRLHLRVGENLQPALAAGTITATLKCVGVGQSAPPGIRVFNAIESDGGFQYLSDAATAAAQYSQAGTPLGVVQGSTTLDLPVSVWAASSSAYLLFEGVTPGLGELTLEIKQGATVIGQAGSVFLRLLDIREMYQRYRINATAEISDPDKEATPTVSGVVFKPDTNSHFFPAWDEDLTNKSYIVNVHGWRKSPNQARSDEIIIFKRLWLRGFKGRYVGFYWPTKEGNFLSAKFNHSEYIAWKCGGALKALVDERLNSDYDKNVVAHSLGNVVVCSALNLGMQCNRFAMLNGPIPAQCFDPDPALRQLAGTQSYTSTFDTFPTPVTIGPYSAWTGGDLGDDPLSSITLLAYRNRVASVGSARLVNFFLPLDYATCGAWEANNWFSVPWLVDAKPVNGYAYTVGVHPIQFGSRAITDAHEAMAMVSRSMTKAVGTDGRTRGSVAVGVNMHDPGMLFGDDHMAQFKRRLHQAWVFYGRLLTELDYTPSP